MSFSYYDRGKKRSVEKLLGGVDGPHIGLDSTIQGSEVRYACWGTARLAMLDTATCEIVNGRFVGLEEVMRKGMKITNSRPWRMSRTMGRNVEFCCTDCDDT